MSSRLDPKYIQSIWTILFFKLMNKQLKRCLFPIFIFFILKGLFLIFLIPPWEAPDEPEHVSYVIYLYNERKTPSKLQPFILKNIHHSTFRNRKIIASLKKKQLQKQSKLELFERTKADYDEASHNIGSHPPLYYLYLLPFYAVSLFLSSYSSLIFLRIGSLFLGIGSLMTIFYIARALFPQSSIMPVLTTFIVSFQPMFSFMASIVNNDNMVVFIFLVFLYVLMLQFKTYSRKALFLLAFIAGGAPLVKPQLMILLLLFFAYLFLMRRKVSIVLCTILCCIVILPSLIWFTVHYLHEGKDFILYSVQNIKSYRTPLWKYPIEFIQGKQPIGIFMSFWGFFGWLDVPMPKWSYFLYVLFMVVCLSGWWIGRKKINIKDAINTKSITFLIVAFFLYSLTILIFDLQVFTFAHQFVIHGRYLIPLLPLLVIFLLRGVCFFSSKTRKKLIVLLIAFFIAGQVIALMTISSFYYGSFLPKFFISVYKI